MREVPGEPFLSFTGKAAVFRPESAGSGCEGFAELFAEVIAVVGYAEAIFSVNIAQSFAVFVCVTSAILHPRNGSLANKTLHVPMRRYS